MRIALSQCNPRVGDVAGNAALLLQLAREAQAQGAALLVTPELVLSGYPPEDLLLRNDFLDCCAQAVEMLARDCPLPLLVGHPLRRNGHLYNSASLLRGGRIEASYGKHCLPNYQVFDEKRYFQPGDGELIFTLEGLRLAVRICEDLWCSELPLLKEPGAADAVVILNASPFHRAKQAERERMAAQRAREAGAAVLYANLLGGQDELVFDGASFAVAADGSVIARAPAFTNELLFLDVEISATQKQWRGGPVAPELSPVAEVYAALQLGLRDYVQKNGFSGVVLGLSGGIDSALTLAIAADALGAEKVHALILPSRYTAAMSVEDAEAEASKLGVRYDIISIDALFDAYLETLAPLFAGRAADVTEENLQARIRGSLLMAYSNKFGQLLLSTGNKSEMAVGYATLYGDMAGGFALIKDCPKTLVYELARYRNEQGEVIPQRVLERAPSAELAPGQTDQDSLPPYDVLDAIIHAYIERSEGRAEIVARGFSAATVERTLRLIDRAEYKRRQAAPGVRISPLAFGKDRRYPISNGFHAWDPHCLQERS
ncbi:NAD+ synthase [Acidithiobacillus sp. AMEEHan]|uniref:NAD+ synthase n=1 Tax=Acidithiobacillus sp. AMEEHan TaxID=2994951 RepID=UPI0027E528D7|nr:NAD+ synthase [Acidithiobacillus sp. AMEEHan]